MFFRKLVSNLQITTGGSGEDVKYDLDPHPGGHTAKVAQYQVVVVQVSSTNAELTLDLDHGPDGRNFVAHSTPIATTQISGSSAALLSGDADTTKILGEWLRPTLTAGSTGASQEWIMVDVYEMLKPF